MNIIESNQLKTTTSEKISSFEKLPISLFSILFEFMEADSITHLQRGSNRAIFALCGQTLKYNLGKMKVCTLDTLKFTRPLRPHLGTRCCTFNQLFEHSTNLTFINFFDITRIEESSKAIVFQPESPLPDNRLTKLFLALKQNCPKITSLVLKNGSFSSKTILDQVFPYVSSNITRLDIAHTQNPSDELFKEIGTKFPHLEHLNLSYCSGGYGNWVITNVGLQALLKHCHNSLQTLDIEECRTITDEAADYISNCKALTDLNLLNAGLGSRGVQKIVENCKNLTRLNVRWISLDDEAMGAIARCTQLTEIIFGNFSPVHFEILANCQQLKIIEIYKCEDLEFCSLLSNCNTLERLTIVITRISQKDLAQLSKALPNVILDFNDRKKSVGKSSSLVFLPNSNTYYY